MIIAICLITTFAYANQKESSKSDQKDNFEEFPTFVSSITNQQLSKNKASVCGLDLSLNRNIDSPAPAASIAKNAVVKSGCFNLVPSLISLLIIQCDVSRKNTETEYGWGITGLAGSQLNDEKTSLLVLGSYHRYSFTVGHDNLIQLGLQGRRNIGSNKNLWAGAEVAWVHDKSIYDSDTYMEWDNPSSNGFSLGALGGYRLPVEGIDLSAFLSVAYIHFGDFKAGDQLVESGHNSIQIKLGIEAALPFSD